MFLFFAHSHFVFFIVETQGKECFSFFFKGKIARLVHNGDHLFTSTCVWMRGPYLNECERMNTMCFFFVNVLVRELLSLWSSVQAGFAELYRKNTKSPPLGCDLRLRCACNPATETPRPLRLHCESIFPTPPSPFSLSHSLALGPGAPLFFFRPPSRVKQNFFGPMCGPPPNFFFFFGLDFLNNTQLMCVSCIYIYIIQV